MDETSLFCWQSNLRQSHWKLLRRRIPCTDKGEIMRPFTQWIIPEKSQCQSRGTLRHVGWPNTQEISPQYSLEGLMLKLKLWCFGHLMWRADSLKETLMLGKTEGRRRRGRRRMRWLDGIIDSVGMSWASSGSWWQTWKPGMLQSMGSQRVSHNWMTELNWTNLQAGPPESELILLRPATQAALWNTGIPPLPFWAAST